MTEPLVRVLSLDVFALPDIGENEELAECAGGANHISRICVANPTLDVDNWLWCEEHKKGWTKAGDDWQHFSKTWRTASKCDGLTNSDLPTFNRPPLDNCTAPEVIFVRKYFAMFNRIWSCALKTIPTGVKSGILITGQPGFGMYLSPVLAVLLCKISIVFYYLLIRLLQQKQVVPFTADGAKLFLFFGDTVYSTDLSLKADAKPRLPTAKSSSNIFIWSLFDILKRTA